GNIAKLVKNTLEDFGWKVDLINIETPQTATYQSDNRGSGIYLNFFSDNDMVQKMGTWGLGTGPSGPRIDPKAQMNIDLLSTKGNSGEVYKGDASWLGHSVHNNANASKIIIDMTDKAFSGAKGSDNSKNNNSSQSNSNNRSS